MRGGGGNFRAEMDLNHSVSRVMSGCLKLPRVLRRSILPIHAAMATHIHVRSQLCAPVPCLHFVM